MPTPRVAISSDFLDAFARIPRNQQKKVREFITKFQRNPTSAAVNYEPIHDTRDDRVRTVRVDLSYRAIVLHPRRGNVYTLVWVDNHDEAMDWARNKQFSVNPKTGALQVIDVEAAEAVTTEVQEEKPRAKALDEYGPFELFSEEDLLRAGVPRVLLPAVRALGNADQLDRLESYLPAEAYEALFWIANLGYSVDQALNEVTSVTARPETVDVEDIEKALEHPDSQRRFTIVESEADLQSMLDAPLEKWRVFLHPSQAELVRKDFNGPARVLGGAGTGKTVVAMHRARHLARNVFTDPDDRILFITFTRTLSHNISQNLDNLCGDERARIDVVHLHKWAVDYLRRHNISVRIASSAELRKCWDDAMRDAPRVEFDGAFYRAEWENIIKAHRITEKEEYLRIPRRGQGSRLSRLQRAAVWEVFNKFRENLRELGKVEWNDVPALAREHLLEHGNAHLPYRSVIVDETQDLFPEELRLIRQIVPEGPNDLFLVGDAHQRIYSTAPVVMTQCGIEIRGRSRKLYINYRTTEKIRRWSLAVLEGMPIDDMDGAVDDHRAYTSLRSGLDPTIRHFPTLADERSFVIEQIERLVYLEDVAPESICIVAREGRQIRNYTSGLDRAQIPYLYLTRDVNDDAGEGVRLATMHRVKGLEFTHLFMVGVNDGVIPSRYVVAEDEEALRERCLLHVAATRARDTLTITSYGKPSPFLVEIERASGKNGEQAGQPRSDRPTVKKKRGAPVWTNREFDIVLQNPTLSDGEVAGLLPQRTEGAVGWVRKGIHNYHRELDTSMLSKMMLRRLEDGPSVVCPRCGETV